MARDDRPRRATLRGAGTRRGRRRRRTALSATVAAAGAQRRLPVPHAAACRVASRCPRSRQARRRLRHRLGARSRHAALRAADRRGPAAPRRQGCSPIPRCVGVDRLADLQRARDDPPAVIFAPNHHSHLDTPLMATAIPEPWRSQARRRRGRRLLLRHAGQGRRRRRWRSTRFPIDRESTGRKSSDLIRALIDDGWSLVIYPEGGRSPDGWGQDVQGRRGVPAGRTGAPVVPVFIDGTGRDLRQGHEAAEAGHDQGRVRRAAVRRARARRTRRFNARIEAAVDRRSATRRSPTTGPPASAPPTGTSPKLTGPEYTGWRRQWALDRAAQARHGRACAAARSAAGPTSADSIAADRCRRTAGSRRWRTRRMRQPWTDGHGTARGSSTSGSTTGCSPASPGACSLRCDRRARRARPRRRLRHRDADRGAIADLGAARRRRRHLADDGRRGARRRFPDLDFVVADAQVDPLPRPVRPDRLALRGDVLRRSGRRVRQHRPCRRSTARR